MPATVIERRETAVVGSWQMFDILSEDNQELDSWQLDNKLCTPDTCHSIQHDANGGDGTDSYDRSATVLMSVHFPLFEKSSSTLICRQVAFDCSPTMPGVTGMPKSYKL